jgi:hypothetical protein
MIHVKQGYLQGGNGESCPQSTNGLKIHVKHR